jgi:hypothetical protein
MKQGVDFSSDRIHPLSRFYRSTIERRERLSVRGEAKANRVGPLLLYRVRGSRGIPVVSIDSVPTNAHLMSDVDDALSKDATTHILGSCAEKDRCCAEGAMGEGEGGKKDDLSHPEI